MRALTVRSQHLAKMTGRPKYSNTLLHQLTIHSLKLCHSSTNFF